MTVLIEDDTIITDDKVIAESPNSHFVTTKNCLGLDPTFKDVGIHKTPDRKIDIAVAKYKNPPSIIAINRKVKMGHTFEFRFVTLLHVMSKIEALEANKPSSDNLQKKLYRKRKR